jgi:hypothetical protein
MGAIYLFFINSIFICMSTYVVVRYLKLPTKAFEDKERERKVIKYILYVVIITVLPSIYLAYRIVDKSIFESNANEFITHEFIFAKSHIINKSFRYEGGKKDIELLLIGEDLSQDTIDSLQAKLASYNIRDAKLHINQGLSAKQEIDFTKIKSSILEDIFARQEAEKREKELAKSGKFGDLPDLKAELKSLYPEVDAYSLAWASIINYDTLARDTVVMFVGTFTKPVQNTVQEQLRAWLKTRTQADSVVMIIDNSAKRKQRRR